MIELKALLERGYFPRELPPPFTTSVFADVVSQQAATLPEHFVNLNPRNIELGQLSPHDIPNIGLRRRVAGIPNPLWHYKLCREIVNNWQEIQNHCSTSPLSKSIPRAVLREIPNSAGSSIRAIERAFTESDLIPIRWHIRSGSKYILRTDLSRFYPSIYAHSIPWALHTKPVAKAERRIQALLGNKLDYCVRNNQDGQTVGIPIGPDTSLIISEIIMADFDKALINRMPNLQGFRYVDDFELGFKSYAEAEEGLSALRSVLHEYELEVNTQKTEIIPLPRPIDPLWVQELRQHQFRNTTSGQYKDLIAFFDKTISFNNQNPTSHILKYAIRKLGSLEILPENWEISQSFLFHCLMVESNTFYNVFSVLQKGQESGCTLDLDQLESIMNYQIISRCPINQGNEVAWALWALIYWRRTISPAATQVLSQMTDSVVALMALDAYYTGLIPHSINLDTWNELINEPNALYGAHWLLCYEANIKQWLTSQSDPFRGEPNFRFLKDHNVEFYIHDRNFLDLTGASTSHPDVPLFSF